MGWGRTSGPSCCRNSKLTTDAAPQTDGPVGASDGSVDRGRLVVVSGPSGVGKGTVVAALRRRRPEVVVSVSATTRPSRPGERDGVHYHFLSDEQFDELVASGGFVEWAEFAGHRYGTPWSSISSPLEEGRTVVLEIEVQGALQVRSRFADAVLVFLEPPSLAELERRLRGRGTDDPDRIGQRLAIAADELANAGDFDARVVNDDVARAAEAVDRILFG